MKSFGKTKDGVTDSLLRAYVSRAGNPSGTCSEFDPDLANAYLERSLPSGARSRYENHLSECGACRKNVVALVRLAGTAESVLPERDLERVTWLSGLRRVFGAMSRPQWAMATAAALVLAISLPVLMSREWNQPNQRAADSAVVEQQAQTPQEKAASSAAQVANSPSTAADSSTPAAALLKKRETEAAPTPAAAPRAAGVVAGVAGEQKTDKIAPMTADESQRKSHAELASKSPVQDGAGTSQDAKKNLAETVQQRSEKDAAQQPSEPKPGRVDEPRDREGKTKAEEVAAPPPAQVSSEVARSRSGLRPSAKLELRDSSGANESVRANVRKIGKKDFFLRDKTWTDKDFDPGKNLPVVTIIRDSNVYKELLARRAALKAFLDGFSENERAIIVFKGTVYKLIPQK
jgi:hypothetical protein